MTAKNEVLKARFSLNMNRITGLVRLLNTNEALKPTGLFQSEGVRGDILRSVVVFLHATFEVELRSCIPKPSRRLCFSSGTDLDKALRQSGIDVAPFKSLYPPLIQMAKRRNRIVHEGDVLKRTDTVLEAWEFADDWQLGMWMMAIAAFHYQMRLSVNTASVVERRVHEKLRKVMLDHIDFGKQYSTFLKAPPGLRRDALQKMIVTLESITTTMKLDVSESM